MKQSNILDPIHLTLDPTVWDKPGNPRPTLKPIHAHWIKSKIYETLEAGGYADPAKWLNLVLTGSLTTYQYSDESDCDVSLFINSEALPEWSRAEMIGLMVGNLDGTMLPGTTHPMQDFVVGRDLKPHDLYKPGLRSGYDLDTNKWIVPPEKDRAHDVASEENGFYAYALQMADKMERLLRYEPEKAVQFYHQIHAKRMRDQRMGKGDFAESNVIYKFLAQRGLFPKLEEVSGEHIASAVQMPEWDPDEHGCLSVAEKVNELNPHLRYAEGWTRRSPTEEWGNHAWNETPQGEVVDPHAEHFWPEGLEYRHAKPGEKPFEYIAKIGSPESEWGFFTHEPEPGDKWGVMYHAAPSDVRNAIQQQGLKANGDQEIDAEPGVFMTPTHPEHSTDPHYLQPGEDVWEVNVNGLPIKRDPWGEDFNRDYLTDLGGSYYHAGDITPDRLRLVTKGYPGHPNWRDMTNQDHEASATPEPPNYRKQDKPSEHCANCKMMDKGLCWGYGNKKIEPDAVCDSWAPEKGK